MKQQSGQNGFSMLELMVVVAIVTLLAALAAPSFRRIMQVNAISSAVNIFMADMRFARSESIRRGGGVSMCRSNNPEAAPACDAGTGTANNCWASGWIVFWDVSGDGDFSSIKGDVLLRVQGPITAVDSICQVATKNKFPFTATGRLPNLGSGASSFQFGGPAFANDVQKVLCVSVSGRVRIAGDGTASCT